MHPPLIEAHIRTAHRSDLVYFRLFVFVYPFNLLVQCDFIRSGGQNAYGQNAYGAPVNILANAAHTSSAWIPLQRRARLIDRGARIPSAPEMVASTS